MEQKSQKEVLEMLNQMNVAVGIQNLAWYSQQGDLSKTELLLIAGVNPNEVMLNSKKQKVFIFQNACIAGHIPVIEMLLKHGANINIQDDSGKTALHEAIENNKTEVAKTLIKNGADLNIMTNSKVNALYIAEQKKNAEIIDLLKKAGAHQMTEEELKVHKKSKIIGRVSIVIALAGCIWVAQICSTHHSSNSGGGSSSSSEVTHTCLNCNRTYSGYGFATIGGEEYALDKDQGNQYCSRACAKASRTGKFKNM